MSLKKLTKLIQSIYAWVGPSTGEGWPTSGHTPIRLTHHHQWSTANSSLVRVGPRELLSLHVEVWLAADTEIHNWLKCREGPWWASLHYTVSSRSARAQKGPIWQQQCRANDHRDSVCGSREGNSPNKGTVDSSVTTNQENLLWWTQVGIFDNHHYLHRQMWSGIQCPKPAVISHCPFP